MHLFHVNETPLNQGGLPFLSVSESDRPGQKAFFQVELLTVAKISTDRRFNQSPLRAGMW
jgi:hypothetical protein